MEIVSTKKIRNNQKKYFDIAQEETVTVKIGNKYINISVYDDPDESSTGEAWLKKFLSIPQEYRCNPYEMSQSGDLYFADKRNVEYVQKQIAISEKQIKEGKYTDCRTFDDTLKHLETL